MQASISPMKHKPSSKKLVDNKAKHVKLERKKQRKQKQQRLLDAWG